MSDSIGVPEQVILGGTRPITMVEVFALNPIGPPGPVGPIGPVGPPGPQGPPGQVQDAPLDGFTYGRSMAAWVRALPLSGGDMTGDIAFTPTQLIDGGTF